MSNRIIRGASGRVMLGAHTGEPSLPHFFRINEMKREKTEQILFIQKSNDASSLLESPSSSVGSLDPASPRMRASGDNNGGFYVTMTPLNNSNSKVSVSNTFPF